MIVSFPPLVISTIEPLPGKPRKLEVPMPRNDLAVVGHAGPVARGQSMSTPHALSALAALGQPTRLAIFRLLMQSQPAGLPAGAIAEKIGCPQNTLSSHLGILARSGLVSGIRDGRSILYSADMEGMRALIEFLVSDCCNGHPELCSLGTPKPARGAAGKSRKRGKTISLGGPRSASRVNSCG